jgi:hypothetical protein
MFLIVTYIIIKILFFSFLSVATCNTGNVDATLLVMIVTNQNYTYREIKSIFGECLLTCSSESVLFSVTT